MDLIHLATHVGHACNKGENGPIVVCCTPTVIVAELCLWKCTMSFSPRCKALTRYIVIVGRASRRELSAPNDGGFWRVDEASQFIHHLVRFIKITWHWSLLHDTRLEYIETNLLHEALFHSIKH